MEEGMEAEPQSDAACDLLGLGDVVERRFDTPFDFRDVDAIRMLNPHIRRKRTDLWQRSHIRGSRGVEQTRVRSECD